MRSDTVWSSVLRPVLYFSFSERARRRDLKTLAFLQRRGLAMRGDIALIDEHASISTRRLADERRSFERAHEVFQETQADLQKLVDGFSAVRVTPPVKP